MHEKRPVFLTLTQIQFPVTAIISILHRISGVLMFLLLPGILWFLQTSLTAQGFAQLNEFLQRPTGFLLAWVAISAWLFHLLAGVRHLLMDSHVVSDSYRAGRILAWLTLGIFVILTILVGISLW